ncbi:MAG: FdtA/QdtA family cupin domain-containing protein [Pseudomonadota bacterium]|nr:FdtA/QdtA family cupin domain-containing protein [Pseudomonadota bacterium]
MNQNGDSLGRLQPLTVRGDERGSLVAIEGGRDVPFAK